MKIMRKANQINVISEIEPVLRKHNIKRASLFGSFARGDGDFDSDVDILVEFPEGSDLFDLVDLKTELTEILGRDVDIVTFDSLNPYRKEYILKDQISIL
ncbi:MAG: nucleotidyltransferase family protein [Patescibacteria group bacterium]